MYVFLLLLVDSALLSVHSQKTIDFNQFTRLFKCIFVGVENSFALVPCFPPDFGALCSRRCSFEFDSSKLFGVMFLFVLLFTAILLRVKQDDRKVPSPFVCGQSAFPCFCRFAFHLAR